MKTLIDAAKAVIHQRDFYSRHGVYDITEPNPESCDQMFDDWAADLLAHALDAEHKTIDAVLRWPLPHLRLVPALREET